VTYRLQTYLTCLLALLTVALLALAPVSANPASGGYQLFERVASGDQTSIQLASLGNFDYHAKTASECCIAPKGGLTNTDFPDVSARLSAQRQGRHIEGGIDPRTGQPVTGSVMRSQVDAQQVLDAYRSGDATVLGQTQQGFPVVRYDGVTGLNNIPGAGFVNQETNVFIIKGTSSPSIVPTNPNFGEQ